MQTNRSMMPSSIIPELAYRDVGEAVTWLCRVFGFTERLRIANHRAQLRFGDGSLVVTERADSGAGDPPAIAVVHAVMVRVDDVDRHYERAKQAGARIIRPPATHPYGERQYAVEDPGGHRWTFSQSVADVDPNDWGGTVVSPDW